MSALADLERALDLLCPMHVLIQPSGRIAHAGPTLRKLRPGIAFAGQDFFQLVDVLRPRGIVSADALADQFGRKLHLQFRDAPQTRLKGVAAPSPLGQGVVVNLSFGISVPDSLADYALTGADFAPTDLTVEMLYLIEAKSAAMASSRHLNTRLQAARLAAEEQAFTDTLTGLKNRRALGHVLDRLIAGGTDFALMHVDLDYFKAVNDTLGHAAGDHVLQHVARVMVEETRDIDLVARVGGDEFVLVLHDMCRRDAPDRIAARVIARLGAPIPFQGQVCRISSSIGIVLSVDYDAPEAERMLKDADAALYAAKNAGRGVHRFFPDIDSDQPDRPAVSRAVTG